MDSLVVRRWVPWWVISAVWAAVSLAFLALLATHALGSWRTVELDDYGCVAAPAVAGLACFGARRRADVRSGRAWLLLGLSCVSWAAGGAAWTVYEVYLRRDVPFPSLPDAGYLLSVPLGVAALLMFPGVRVVGAVRLRPIVDGLIAAAALLFLSWTTVLGPAFHASTGSLFSQTIALAYPGSDVLMVTMALHTLARARGRQRSTMALVAAGLLIIALADSAFAWFTAHGDYASGNLFDAGYVAGFLLIAVAAFRVATTLSPVAGAAAEPAPPSRLALVLPYVPPLLSLPWIVALQVGHHPIDPVAVDIVVFLIGAVLLRQLLSLRANVALSRQLHDSNTTLRQREVDLEFQAFHDPLTGLANRKLLIDRANHILARARRPGQVIMLLADLDDFKAVNDTLGHQAGDALLVSLADRLRAVVRPEDTVARLGGDEFAVLLDDVNTLTDARLVADRIGDALLRPFDLSGIPTVIGASIGIATVGTGSTSETLLREADIAMYAAKNGGKGRFAVFAGELAAAGVDRVQLKTDLADAVRRDELSLKYQPILDLKTGRLCGVEALLRWSHPTRGQIEPDAFVPLAEATGAIWPIGRWVLHQACAQAGRWHKQRPAGVSPLTLSINISGRQLADPQLIPTVRAALAAAELDPALVTIEVTEQVLSNEDLALAPLQALHDLGLHLAIDDFGTGHTALTRLRHYPIDTLKIDQSFVAALTPDAPIPDVFITAILTLGQGLGMDVIAEGVENNDQLAALRALGCPKAQGFLFARPAQPDVITELIYSTITLLDPENTLA